MDWARDQLGNLVRASQRGLLSYRYYCGNCGELVFKRAGTKNRPHFAHYGHSAKECEDYNPSSNVTVHRGQRDYPAPTQRLSRGGIYWGRTELGTNSLFLKLPHLQQIPAGMGEYAKIEIHTSLGVRSYRAFQLKNSRFISLVPRLPLVEVHAEKELAALGVEINNLVENFRSSGNYFAAGDSNGRLLVSDEPLEWGESYWLVTQNTLGPIPEDLGLQVESEALQGIWYSYEIALPILPEVESRREAIARFLERTIRIPRARVYFVEPPPHHIHQVDGTYVFPKTTERIVLRKTERSCIRIGGSPQAIVTDLADEWVEITSIGKGDFTVLLDGCEELFGRIEDCELFQPRGVCVTLGDSTWEIFEPELHEAIRQGSIEGMLVECPSQRVAESLSLTQEMWAREGASYILRGEKCYSVDAGNFGVLALPLSAPSVPEVVAVDPQSLARRAWIEGIVARACGPDAVMRLCKQWDKSLPMNLSSELAWLRPYIVSAKSS